MSTFRGETRIPLRAQLTLSLLALCVLAITSCDESAQEELEDTVIRDVVDDADALVDSMLDTDEDAVADTGSDTQTDTREPVDGDAADGVDAADMADGGLDSNDVEIDTLDVDAEPLPTLEAWALTPRYVSVEGGSVEAVGRGFTDATRVFIGDTEALSVSRVDETTLTFEVPSMASGEYDVTLERGTDRALFPEPFGVIHFPGPSGGAIVDSIEVIIHDRGRTPIENAFVMLGTDPMTSHQGFTDPAGRIEFNGLGGGPVTVAATAVGYGTLIQLDVDAQRVKMNLNPSTSQSPPAPEWPLVSGQITGMDQIPAPGQDEVRLAFVVPSQGRMNPPSSPDNNEVTETDGTYQVAARVGLQAIAVFGGVLDTTSGAFTPHRMGLAREVFLREGAVATVDLALDIPLDSSLTVQLAEFPTTLRASAHYLAGVALDLGPEGTFRPGFFNRRRFSTETTSPSATVGGLPALSSLGDGATYLVEAHLVEQNMGSTSVFGSAYSPDVTDTSQPVAQTIPALATVNEPRENGTFQGQVQFETVGAHAPDLWLFQAFESPANAYRVAVIAPPGIRTIDLPTFPDFSTEPPERRPEPYPSGTSARLQLQGQIYDSAAYDTYDDYGDPGLRSADVRGQSRSSQVVVTW